MKLSLRKSLAATQKRQAEPTSDNDINISDLSVQSIFQLQNLVQNQTEDHSVLSWPICLMPIFYVTLVILLMYHISGMNEPEGNPVSAQGTLKTLQVNLARSPIIDIANQIPINHLHRHFRTCPIGYDIAELGYWRGVNSGCICKGGKVVSMTYCLTHFDGECKNVAFHQGYSFTYWKGSQLCVLYAQKWRWVGHLDCPEEFHKCGEGICLHINHPCPLTGLIPSEPSQFTIQIGGHHYSKVRDNTSPIVQFSVTPGDRDTSNCYNMNLMPEFQSKKYYPLSIQPEKGCDTYGSVRNYTITLDKDFQLNVYDDNAFNDLNKIPYFYDYIDSVDTYSLEVIKRIYVNTTTQCNHVDAHNLKQMRLQGEIIHSFTSYISSTTIVLGIFLLITSALFFLCRSVDYQSISLVKFQHIQYQLIVSCLIGLASLALGIIYFTQADGENGLNGKQTVFRAYQKENCFADQGIQLAILQVIDFALRSYQDTEPYVKIGFYMAIFYTILMTLLLILSYKKYQRFFIKPWEELKR